MSNITHFRIHFEGGWIPFWVLLLIASALLAYAIYRRTVPPAGSWMRGLLCMVRSVALFLLILAIMEPIVTLILTRQEKPVIALLVDRSESMALKDKKGDRAQILRDLLQGEVIETLRRRAHLETFQFADSLSALDTLRIDGKATNIGRALLSVRERLEDRPLQSILLLSDGANNLGSDPGIALQKSRIPIYAVGIGDPSEIQDIKITRVSANDIGYTGTQIPIEVTLRAWGYEGAVVPLRITESGSPIAHKTITLSGQGEEQVFSFTVTSDKPGVHRYQAEIPLQPGELTEDNNRQPVFIRVLESKVRILMAAGSPSPDLSFLSRSWKKNPDVDMDIRIVKQGTTFYGNAFPQSVSELDAYDLIVLLNVPRKTLRPSGEQALRDVVQQQGKALLIVGGPLAFGPGGYGGSPLEDLLPLRSRSGPTFREGTFSLQLTAEGRGHPIFRLTEDPVANASRWADLPPLLAWNEITGASPDAMVLAVHPTATVRGQKMPLVAIRRAGPGKVMVMAVSTIWRWDLMMWGIEGAVHHPSAFDQTCANLVRWLVTREEGRLVKVKSDKRVYRGGEPVHIEAQVYDETYRPLPGAEVRLTVQKGEEKQDLLLKDLGNGRYEAELSGLKPGDYIFSVQATIGGRSIERSNGAFAIGPYTLELEHTRMDQALLSRLSYEGGGQFYVPENIAQLLEDMDWSEQRMDQIYKAELWNRPPLMALILLLLCTEWTIRRRRGMV